jgi:hypothetical protein
MVTQIFLSTYSMSRKTMFIPHLVNHPAEWHVSGSLVDFFFHFCLQNSNGLLPVGTLL